MNKQEAVNIVKYLYFLEARLSSDVDDTVLRYLRRELDSVDLLEEIIAKERLKLFYEIEADLIKILQLTNDVELTSKSEPWRREFRDIE